MCVLQSFDIAGDPGPQTSYEVSIFESGTWKKVMSGLFCPLIF